MKPRNTFCHYGVLSIIIACFLGLLASVIIGFTSSMTTEGSIAVTTPIVTTDISLTETGQITRWMSVAILHDSANNQDYIVVQNDKNGNISITPRITKSDE